MMRPVTRPVMIGRVLAPVTGVGAMPYPAPAGYRWALVVENGNQVTENGNRVVELQRAA